MVVLEMKESFISIKTLLALLLVKSQEISPQSKIKLGLKYAKVYQKALLCKRT